MVENPEEGINNFEIRKGRLLGACQSVDNCRLFVGGIPKSKKRDEIMEEMKKVTEGNNSSTFLFNTIFALPTLLFIQALFLARSKFPDFPFQVSSMSSSILLLLIKVKTAVSLSSSTKITKLLRWHAGSSCPDAFSFGVIRSRSTGLSLKSKSTKGSFDFYRHFT